MTWLTEQPENPAFRISNLVEWLPLIPLLVQWNEGQYAIPVAAQH